MTRWAREAEFDALFRAAAAREAPGANVPASYLVALAKAVTGEESGFDPTAYHWDGPDAALNVSRGLMQIEGTTAQRYGLSYFGIDGETGPNAPHFGAGRDGGLYIPAVNVPIGVALLAANLRSSSGDVAQAIAAYNEGLVRASREAPGPYSNQGYVDAVLDNLQYFLDQDTPSASAGASSSDAGVNAGKAPAVVLAAGLLVLTIVLLWVMFR